jgi:hypothetical protein
VCEPLPGVRRLCAATATEHMGLLASACQSGETGRLFITTDLDGRTGIAFAPPGVDEVAVMTQLITALHRLAADEPGASRPVLLAFHVGITRIGSEGPGGPAVMRARSLLANPAVCAAAAVSGGPLTVIISDGLYADLRPEGLPGQDWTHIPAAHAWIGFGR